MKKATHVAVVLAFFCGCSSQLAGPCYQAMQYRNDAENATGAEKAALLGKADAAQRECDHQGEAIQERQKRDAMNRAR